MIFNHLSEKNLLNICQKMEKIIFKNSDIIVKENTMGDKFYLISEGRVKVMKNEKYIRDLEEGSCFGEISILLEEKRTASIIAINKVKCFALDKDNFLEFLDKQMINYLKEKISLQDNSILLKDIYLIDNIGEGKFGIVHLVHNKKNFYAIKAVSRKNAENQIRTRTSLMNEKQILLSLDHPFIVKLVKTLKNEYFCFFLMEFISYVNLYQYLSYPKRKILNVTETQFFAANLLTVLEYLNSKKICHRDLKPENIMIDKKGYLKLIDFGSSKFVNDFTYTVTGTPHYIAPEIVLGRGYNNTCDYWSLGVCVFEIFYGKYPYGNDLTDIMDIYKNILYGSCYNPPKNNPEFNIFVKKLLSKKPNLRETNLKELLKNSFFKNFNLEDLYDLKINPIYKPDFTKISSLGFDSYKGKYEETLNRVKYSFNSFEASKNYDNDQVIDTKWADEF